MEQNKYKKINLTLKIFILRKNLSYDLICDLFQYISPHVDKNCYHNLFKSNRCLYNKLIFDLNSVKYEDKLRVIYRKLMVENNILVAFDGFNYNGFLDDLKIIRNKYYITHGSDMFLTYKKCYYNRMEKIKNKFFILIADITKIYMIPKEFNWYNLNHFSCLIDDIRIVFER